MAQTKITKPLLAWFEHSGRHDLPWQINPTPYRVWISEIMLQQTQVQTVIPYFERFMVRFPELTALAQAPEDEVLSLWSGLGYYSRAKRIHQTAAMVLGHYDGQMPNTLEDLMTLPGIGRSTAGAILSLGFQIAAPILDGNVKRVLARYYAIEGWVGRAEVLKTFWSQAELNTPDDHQVAAYTQAIMDLGATVCTKTKPVCSHCPLQSDCQAHASDKIARFPFKAPTKTIPQRSVFFVLLLNEKDQLYLEKRPDLGIWPGLYSFPELKSMEGLDELLDRMGLNLVKPAEALKKINHAFSHYKLAIEPMLLRVRSSGSTGGRLAQARDLWCSLDQMDTMGLPAPVRKIIMSAAMAKEMHHE